MMFSYSLRGSCVTVIMGVVGVHASKTYISFLNVGSSARGHTAVTAPYNIHDDGNGR